jgi:light-regulated signal transduction histidine kinase (bacteriophytochrome)
MSEYSTRIKQGQKEINELVEYLKEQVKKHEDEPTLEHLFGDAQYDIDKLALIDDETAYQLYGTEAKHFKNHMAKVAERDLKKYKTDEEDTQSETSLNHMFGNVFEQLDNLKLKKKGEK